MRTLHNFQVLLTLLSALISESQSCEEDYCACLHDKQASRFSNCLRMDAISVSELPTNLEEFLKSCVLDVRYQLTCSWNTSLALAEEYSVSIISSPTEERLMTCDRDPVNGPIGCHGQAYEDRHEIIILQVNMSLAGQWINTTVIYAYNDVDKVDPPQNITTSISSDYLVINWAQPRSVMLIEDDNHDCFDYQLRINNAVQSVGSQPPYKELVDLTRKYLIQMRAKRKDDCFTSRWSDWSTITEVAPSERAPGLNPAVIAVIILVLPMILLSLLLLYKMQRVKEKLFPSIPSPSAKIKLLLERENSFQVVVHKCVEIISEVEDEDSEPPSATYQDN